MHHLIAIAVGGACGSVARHWLGEFVARAFIDKHSVSALALGTLSVNVSGSLIIGLVWVILENREVNGQWLGQWLGHFLMVGLLGGFTTFSAFSLQTMQLIQQAQWLMAAANMAANLMACMLAVALGMAIGKMIIG